jgi:hypothetical protein
MELADLPANWKLRSATTFTIPMPIREVPYSVEKAREEKAQEKLSAKHPGARARALAAAKTRRALQSR